MVASNHDATERENFNLCLAGFLQGEQTCGLDPWHVVLFEYGREDREIRTLAELPPLVGAA